MLLPLRFLLYQAGAVQVPPVVVVAGAATRPRRNVAFPVTGVSAMPQIGDVTISIGIIVPGVEAAARVGSIPFFHVVAPGGSAAPRTISAIGQVRINAKIDLTDEEILLILAAAGRPKPVLGSPAIPFEAIIGYE